MIQVVDKKGVVFLTLAEAFEKYGYDKPSSKYLRPELQRFPMLKGLLGPMWSGNSDVARYETPEVFEILSK